MRSNQPVPNNVMGRSKPSASKLSDKAGSTKPGIERPSRNTEKGMPMSAGAVGRGLKITLQSANQDVDERAEVTVALNNPEEAVERMVRALAQRFPPESVMTIQPVGNDQKPKSNALSSESRERTTPSTSDVLSSDMSSMKNGSVHEVEHGREDRYTSPSSTAVILGQDPKTLRSLLRLASKGGDPNEWARKFGLNPKTISKLVDDLVRDLDFHDWVERLASPDSTTPAKKSKGSYSNQARSRQKHPTQSDKPGVSRTGRPHLQPPAYPRSDAERRGCSGQYEELDRRLHPRANRGEGHNYASPPGASFLQTHTTSDASVQDYYHEPPTIVQSSSSLPRISAGSDGELVPGFGEHIVNLEDGSTVRYIEVEVIEEKIIEIPQVEIREIERIERVKEIREIERIEEVDEIEWIEKIVEVDKEEYTTKKVSVKQVVDRPRQLIIEKSVTIPRKVEKVVEVPEIIETPVPYDVEEKVSVPRYVNQESPTVVAQRLRPIVRESDVKTRVAARSYEPVVYTVDVFIPKPVEKGLISHGKIAEFHQMVEVPAAQYNTLLKNMNSSIPSSAIQDLFVRETGGMIPMLPVAEYDEPVPPYPSVRAIAAKNRYSREILRMDERDQRRMDERDQRGLSKDSISVVNRYGHRHHNSAHHDSHPEKHRNRRSRSHPHRR